MSNGHQGGIARALVAQLQGPLRRARQLLRDACDDPSSGALEQALEALQPAIDALSVAEAYTAPPSNAREPVDLRAWLAARSSSVELVVESDVDDDEEPLVAYLDVRLLGQAIDELLRNSQRAGARRASLGLARRGAQVELRVEDDGRGMPVELAARAFEPFVVGDGGGSGFGLARVHGFVHSHGGSAHVVGSSGVGTTIALLLPLATEANESAATSRQVTLAVSGSATKRESRGATVLVVDDEPLALKAAKRALERGGYRVLTADRAAEALAVLDGDADIDVLLSDVVMPDMTGVDLGHALRDRQPELLQVFTSGYPREAVPSLPDGAEFIEKPFSGRELSAMLDRLLERRRGD